MWTAILKTARNHVTENLKYYITMVALFLAGGIVALVATFSMSELDNKELLLYLNDFFTTLGQTGSDGFTIFQMAIAKNAKEFGLLFACAVMVIGTPFIAAYCAVKGFVSFFTVSFLFKAYGIRAALFFLVGMLPHILITLPCYAYLTVLCMKFSLSLTSIREKTDFKTRFLRFLILFCILFAVSVMSALLQAYIEPLFMKLISVYFISIG